MSRLVLFRRSVLTFLLIGLAGAFALAQENTPRSGRHSLRDLIRRTIENSPELERAAAAVAAAEGRQDQANGARFPQIQLLGTFGPSPQARGTVVASPDRKSDPNINGVFVRFDLLATQPLYTFGRISSLRRAADAGVRVEQARTDEARGNVVMRTKELYFGKLLTLDLLGLADDLAEGMGKSIERVQSRLQANTPDADEADLHRLKSYLAMVVEARAEVLEKQQVATAALRAFAGLPGDDPVELDAPGLSVPTLPSETDAASIEVALDLRPEMRQARAGVEATAALARSERSGLYPLFFLGLIGSYATASNRDFQENFFVQDPLNDYALGVGLGARYQLDFGITLGRIRQARAENQQVVAQRRFAQIGIPVEVMAARRNLDAAMQTIRVTEEGSTSARRWLVVAQANYDMGVGEVGDLGNAVEAYAKLRSDYLMAIHRANLAVARLAHVTGRDSQER
jgi:outer membrane protein TolC